MFQEEQALGPVPCSAETTKEYTPQVADVFKPIRNLEFRNLEEVYKFYNKYAFEAGFSIRRSTTAPSKDGSVILRQVSLKRLYLHDSVLQHISKVFCLHQFGYLREDKSVAVLLQFASV